DGHVVVYHAHPAAEQRGVIVPAVRTAVDALLPGKDGLQQIARGKNARKTCRCNGNQYKNNQSPDGAPYPYTYIYSIAKCICQSRFRTDRVSSDEVTGSAVRRA